MSVGRLDRGKHGRSYDQSASSDHVHCHNETLLRRISEDKRPRPGQEILGLRSKSLVERVESTTSFLLIASPGLRMLALVRGLRGR